MKFDFFFVYFLFHFAYLENVFQENVKCNACLHLMNVAYFEIQICMPIQTR